VRSCFKNHGELPICPPQNETSAGHGGLCFNPSTREDEAA
jgi:hypothetical protein